MPQDADAARLAGAAPDGGAGAGPRPAPPRPGPPRAVVPEAAAPADADALAPLDGLDALPVAEHVDRFETVHDALRARLESRPTAGGGA
jgi:hypothetical protein